MLRKFFAVVIVLTIFLFWTSVHYLGGSLDYELVIKPYPTSDLAIGGGEEGSYKRRLEQGEFPEWLKNKNYMIIAEGSYESKTQIWEYLHWTLIALVFFGWFFTIVNLITKELKALNKFINKEK
ncbi:hypothetical protein [Pseudoalteromonas luteoviolacea]|uniref:Uncharacterized protein n=1 Tax=Pseudoalteromonas luteoviolacea S4060-1 TaxID=1365257 RepID=A0A167PD91_9GAMM|nr:hypothetical protein [Pseudoalteromonas luteoviolacea]KZN70391.1 hypothetical protein N478_00375 [Pseudoalteromonas luteoviolacea S4060-1]